MPRNKRSAQQERKDLTGKVTPDQYDQRVVDCINRAKAALLVGKTVEAASFFALALSVGLESPRVHWSRMTALRDLLVDTMATHQSAIHRKPKTPTASQIRANRTFL